MAAATIVAVTACTGSSPLPTVHAVIDGDTIEVSIAGRIETVRLLGVDTPETVHPDRPPECFGPEASALLHELLPRGTAVDLAVDVESRDHFGRLLATVHRRADQLFVNEHLLVAGAARALSIAPNTTLSGHFAAAERRASSSGRGLWSACPSG